MSIIDPSFSFGKSDNVDEINLLLDKEKKELDKLKGKIKTQTTILNRMGKKVYSVLKKQRILDDQLKAKEKELNIYNWNLIINKKKISKLTKNIEKSEAHLYSQQKILGKRLRTIYKQGDLFPVKMVFASKNIVDLLLNTKYLDKTFNYDKNIFSKYKIELEDFQNKKNVLFEEKKDLVAYQNRAKAKKNQIALKKESKKKFLARLKHEKKINKQLKDELVGSSEKLNKLISRLEYKIIHGEGLDIADKKGKLPSPVEGKILSKFGRKRDKKYDTFIVDNGVTIDIKRGEPVRSVFEGKVLYTGTLEGYGNIIIVGHGKNYHSLYGHLDEIITSPGKNVRTRQIIGRSGDTGSMVGESLYFEMRYKGKPIEPTAWLLNKK
ncbi:uncharacterized protein METZ01_LOCUS229846 [marine metagenome]|uniref:M23ase beta-sheet core domain-containing protein n=1 Tax=marine metagenome TaxID=408172 RepID=A0A382GQ25_9ZZZZ